MTRTSLLTLAAILAGCGQAAPKGADDGAKVAQASAAPPSAKDAKAPKTAEAPKDAAPAADPWKKQLDSRVLADSGLGVGGKLIAFEIRNAATDETYCQVCRYGSRPKIMVAGTPDDPKFQEAVKDVDAIVKKFGQDKVVAFAVASPMKGGKAVTPPAPERDGFKKEVSDLLGKLGVEIPVVIPEPEDGPTNRQWDEYYNITKSPTIMFADGKNTVRYSAAAPDDLADLGAAIEKTVQAG